MKKTKNKKRHLRLKLMLLKLVSLIACLTPLAVVLIRNNKDYFQNYNGIKVSTGLIVAAFWALLLVKGQLKKLNGMTPWIVVFLLFFLLESIIQDMVLLSGMALVGKAIYVFIFETPIKRLARLVEVEFDSKIQAEAQAEAMGSVVEQVLNKINGRV